MIPGVARSLRLKLIGVILLTTLAALVVALVAIVGYDLRAYQRTWTADMSTQAELLGRMSAPALAFDVGHAAYYSLPRWFRWSARSTPRSSSSWPSRERTCGCQRRWWRQAMTAWAVELGWPSPTM